MLTFVNNKKEDNKYTFICKFISDCLIIVVFAYILIMFTCCRTTISGNSMKSTFENGDKVLINQMSYVFKKPKRNDIIAFKLSNVKSSKIYVKRIIGLPGDTIQIKDGHVYINGSIFEDDKFDDYILTSGIAKNEFKLNKNEYFVLGDNRNNSEDSRFANIGTINKDNIIGSVWMILTPFKHMQLV